MLAKRSSFNNEYHDFAFRVSALWVAAGRAHNAVQAPNFEVFLDATFQSTSLRRSNMQWSKPQATDLRFGFEVTMYIFNR